MQRIHHHHHPTFKFAAKELTSITLHSNRRGETVILGLSFHMLSWVFNRIFSELDS